MSLVPQNLDFRRAAEACLAKARDAAPLRPTRDAHDVAVALKCIGSYQVYATEKHLHRLDEEQHAAPLIAAARILQSVAQHLRIQNNLRPDEANDLYMHAAIAHAMCGNSPSAAAVLREVDADYQFASPLRGMAAVVCDPRARTFLKFSNHSGEIGKFHDLFSKSLREAVLSARQAFFDEALGIIEKHAIAPHASTVDRSYVLSMIAAARQAFRLATVSLLTQPAIPPWFVENSIDAGIMTLLPPQRQLLCDVGLAGGHNNALLTLPTSTGKTFIAEACIAAAAAQGGICIYVAPYVAIGEQVKQSLERKRFHEHMEVVSMFGGFKTESLVTRLPSTTIIATPERFDAWMRASDQIESLRLVVFDEVHIIESDTRGSRVEGLLTRLRLLQRRLPKLRILCLSAVLSAAEALEKWIGVRSAGTLKMAWRPTARRLATCDSMGWLQWIHGNDSLRPHELRADSAITRRIQIKLPEPVFPSRSIGAFEDLAAKNVATVALDLLKRLGSSGLIVCPRRTDTRLLARALSARLPKVQSVQIKNITAQVRNEHPWLNTLADCLEHGVAYHNASLPFDVRRAVEALVRNHSLTLVCSTTTLAEGADFPFRWTLVSHWLSSFRGDGKPMKSMTFRNIAGRSGRAGAFAEGDTILFENTIGPPNAFAERGKRSSPDRLTRVMFSSSPVDSTVGHSWSDGDTEQKRIRAAFGSQLLACIGEHPSEDRIAETFAESTYSAYLVGPDLITEIVESGLRDILNPHAPGGALAERNSPLKLTALGRQANRSGFSPASVRRMMEYLSTPTADWQSQSLFSTLLVEFHDLDEQPSYLLKKVAGAEAHRFPMKKGDLHVVIASLLLGESLRSVFEELPGVVKSKGRPDYLEAKFDEFVTFVETSVWGFLPWVLRAFNLLAPFAHYEARKVPWQEFSRDLDNRSSAALNDRLGARDADAF